MGSLSLHHCNLKFDALANNKVLTSDNDRLTEDLSVSLNKFLYLQLTHFLVPSSRYITSLYFCLNI